VTAGVPAGARPFAHGRQHRVAVVVWPLAASTPSNGGAREQLRDARADRRVRELERRNGGGLFCHTATDVPPFSTGSAIERRRCARGDAARTLHSPSSTRPRRRANQRFVLGHQGERRSCET
jgi:hypothetical protein